jgi:hypothetical protein
MKKHNYFITCLIVLFLLTLNSSIYGQIVKPYVVTPIENDTVKIELNKTIKEKFLFFSDKLADNWENWSWGCQSNFKSKDYVYNGDYAIEAKLYRYGGLAIGSHKGLKTNGYTKLGFFINGGAIGGQKLKVYVNDRKDNGIRTPVPLIDKIDPNKWNFICIPLKELDAVNITIYKINISDTSGNDQSPSFYVDDIILFK